MSSKQSPSVDGGRASTGHVDVVIVSYEKPELLDACVRSTQSSSRTGAVIVVDNSISSACADVVARNHPTVLLVRPPSNVGYGQAANQGIAAASTDVVLLLNADTCLTSGAVEAIAGTFAEHDDAAVVGPRLLDQRGVTQPSCARFPTAGRVWLQQSGLWKVVRHLPRGRRVEPFFAPEEPGPVPWVLGAALGLRRSSFERIGGFDPAFFMYYEEVDLCRRLASIGETTHYTPAAQVHHVGGASTDLERAAMLRTMYRSLATFMAKHAGDRHQVRLRSAVAFAEALQVGRDLLLAAARRPRRASLSSARHRLLIVGDAVRNWRGAGDAPLSRHQVAV